MPAEDEALKQKFFPLSLSGQVTVHFVNGHTLKGRFAAQDLWNIFLMVDNQPVMIPRTQILYLKGEPGRQIERDSSQKDFYKSAATAVTDADLFETADFLGSAPEQTDRSGRTGTEDTQGSDEGTSVARPDAAESAPDTETAAFPPDVDETGRTFVLDEIAAEKEEAEAVGFVFPAEDKAPAKSDAAGDDMTVVLDEEEDEDEITYVLETEEEGGPSARLVCTTGPHIDEEFALSGETVTLGRARDNDVPLSRDKEVSRRHAVIKQEAGSFVIQDHNSLNGTFVNSERVTGTRILKNGDTILVGVSDLVFYE